MIGFIYKFKKSFDDGWKITALDSDTYHPFLYAGKVIKSDGLWAYVIVIGPYYLIFNRKDANPITKKEDKGE